MSMQIDKIYKPASNRVKLLQKIRPNIAPLVAEKIYNVMIMPVPFYCYPVYLCIVENAKKKLESIQDRAHKIIAPTKTTLMKIDTLDQIRKKRVSIDVLSRLMTLALHHCETCLSDLITARTHEETARILCYQKLKLKLEEKHLPFKEH